MSLRVMDDVNRIRRQMRVLSDTLGQGTESVLHYVGWRDGPKEFPLQWNAKLRFWHHFQEDDCKWWCIYGTMDPVMTPNNKGHQLYITVEVNPPKKPTRRFPGALVEDDEGLVYLAHSGDVRGGRKGICKSEFLKYYRGGNFVQAVWPNGSTGELIVLGRVDGVHLPAAIASYVHEVDAFKARQTGGLVSSPEVRIYKRRPVQVASEFVPRGKVATTRKGTRSSEYEVNSYHDPVVDALSGALSARGLERQYYSKECDLFLRNGGNMSVLFEVKTSTAPYSLYTGVGQLLLHSTSAGSGPQKVLVVPVGLEPATRSVIEKLAVRVVPYHWEGDRPVFENLDEALK